MLTTQKIEKAASDWVRRFLPSRSAIFVLLALKILWASLFGILILIGIIVTKLIWTHEFPIYRYDALVLWAVGLQVAFLLFKLETWDEAKVILLFHITGTLMEYFKVNAGSWSYPEPGYLKILNVPLFTGFMYASVGSFIARSIRLFDMQFFEYPRFVLTVILAVAIYVNFFAHHFLPDIRLVLFAATLVLFFRTKIKFTLYDNVLSAPMLVGVVLSALFLWIAENVGTRTGTWEYPGQGLFELVSLSKMGSWYLLIFVSFVTVTLVSRDALVERKR